MTHTADRLRSLARTAPARHTGTVDQTMPRPFGWSALRWVMSGLVIAGILAMHVLGGHDGGGSAPMVMGPAGPTMTAMQAMSANMSVSTNMSMNMSVSTNANMSTHPEPTVTVADRSPVSTMIAAAGSAGNGMSDMSCCILFLITAAATVLLALLATGRFAGSSAAGSGSHIGTTTWWRGPPGDAPPRFSLCVLRV
jgi:hypothetical protein